MDISKVSGNIHINAFKVKHPEVQNENRKYEEPPFTKEGLNDAVNMLNAAAKTINNRIAFSVDEKTDRIIMRVLDANNNEVIREIPPKEVIRLAAQIREMIGMFIDESR